jgi:hypothetical protein
MICEICSEQLTIPAYELIRIGNRFDVILKAHCDACDHSQTERLPLDNYYLEFVIIAGTKRKVMILT